MNADLAQRIALVSHGNAFLAGLGAPYDLLAENSAFQYVSSVTFRTPGRSIDRIDLWYEALAERGVHQLSVREDDLVAHAEDLWEKWLPSTVLISDEFEERRERIIESFGETGEWDDEEHRATSAILGSTDRPYKLSLDQEPLGALPPAGSSLTAAREALVEAVTEARTFAVTHELGYADSFDKSRGLAQSERPVAPYHPDLLPNAGYSLDARQVIAAAAQAWVFGAWGWGDRVFPSESVETEFWLCDAKLRAAVIEAMVAATNAFDGSQEGRTVS